jgi:hypothetical protein
MMGFAMAIVAPKERKPLSAAALLRLVRSGFDTVPDPRSLDAEISFTDALMSAFAMFALQSPSLLAFDPQRAEGKVKTIYGMACVPCDTRMRERLDPMSPEALRPLCKSVCRQIQRGKALEPMACLEDDYCVALDGTGSCSSKPIHCASCLHKVHRNGSSPSSHQMLGAAIIHPEGRAVMPLMPEPLVKQDGTVKNDGERHAAKRFLGKLRQDHPHLTGMVTADSLRANAPHIETLPAHGLHAILGVKEGDHASLCQQGQAAEQRGGVTFYARHDRDAGLVPRFRFVNDVSLKESNAEVRVNVIEDWARRTDAGQHWSWVTDLRVSQRNVYHLMRGGRARWKMANATLNTLKNQGSHFEHNYGHGTQHLSVGFAMVMLLALVVDQPQQLCCALCQAVWAKLGSKRLLWERMRALCDDDALESMRQLLETLLYGLKKLHPLLAVDAS